MSVLKSMPVSFPGLFGEWEMTASPVCFSIGEKHIYWYGVIIASGLLLALMFCLRQTRHYGVEEDDIYDLVIWGIPVGILGARTYYVIFYLSRFQNADGTLNFRKAIAIWDGGLAIYGAIIACMVLAFVLCRVKKLPMGAVTDVAVMGLLIGQMIGRWGNFMNREAFGAETTLPWRMRLWVSVSEYIEVHPTFLYESLWNLLGLLLIVLVVSKARRFDGENTWFYFLWYGLGRTWVEGLRTDSLYLFDWQLFGQPIRVSQALSITMVLVSALMLLYHLKLRPHDPEQMLVRRKARLAEEGNNDTAEPAENEKERGM
ncbi:MAG: prolipoprotein diacylglyceryl transferase [Oscillospiraceae bacterium]|nr:prolipoprotein diacylglyceryl transferase [Oscillospiraceae bacterium]